MARDLYRFRGKLLTLVTRKVRLPNGHTVRLEIVRHPGAALIVPFLDKAHLVLLRQLRPVIGAYLYELPAGTLNRNESPLACARREIIEETGFAASRLTRLGAIHPVPGYSTEKIFVYKAEGLKKGRMSAQADEILTVRVVTKRQVKDLFKKGMLTDAKTICALAFCGWL